MAKTTEVAGATNPGTWSLRRRVLILTLVVTALGWVLGGLAITIVQKQVSETLFDQRLKDIASALVTFADHEISELQEAGADVVHLEGADTLGVRYKYQVWAADGQLLLISINTPRAPFVAQKTPGYYNETIAGEPMRVVVMPTADGHKILEVAEPLSARHLSWNQPHLPMLAVPLVLSLALLFAVGSFLANRTTRSLVEAATQVTQRTPADLRPLAVSHAPAELAPIVDATNALFARIQAGIANERRFTSSAAHELRSPLAAIKLQAQIAILSSTDTDRREALRFLMSAIDAASHMIDQLLTLSRVDGLIALKSQMTPLQLDSVGSHVIDEMRPLVARRNQTLEERLDAADIDGLEFGIAVLLRNLIDNASRYSHEGKTIRVTSGTEDDGSPFLCVDDQGPGIPPEERQRVFERFTRLSNETNADGCGIGLSIVQAVVELHHARISLDQSDLGGLRICVHFPPSVLADPTLA